MWNYKNVRDTFIRFFEDKGHTYIKPSPLIPTNDPSLLFTNSGMVQFKNIFLGKKAPYHKLACNSQRCIRAGGKHNDLDDVGRDCYHHTCFEMLGSWSFNYTSDPNCKSYFKQQAIDLAWDLLINVYGLDSSRIYVTYFEGTNQLECDTETKDLWDKYLPSDRILPFGMKDNFWEVGAIGPCGPSTEIHYDRIGGRDASSLVNRDDPTVIEIWNLVFVQHYRTDTELTKLANAHVDTGMGLERLISILCNCTNYQIDIFNDLINIINVHTGAPAYVDLYGSNDSQFINTAYRVIADHIRTIIYAICDGVVPEASDRGYVLRRILRRTIRYCCKLNSKAGLLTGIITECIDYLASYDPFILDHKNTIVKIISNEDAKFTKALIKGMTYFTKITVNPSAVKMTDLINLYTTYGLPIDIIKQMCEEKQIDFIESEYQTCMSTHSMISKNKK